MKIEAMPQSIRLNENRANVAIFKATNRRTAAKFYSEVLNRLGTNNKKLEELKKSLQERLA